MERCPFCHSENTDKIGTYESSFPLEKPEIRNGIKFIRPGTFRLFTDEYLCLDCDMVFKKISEKNLSEYKDWKKYFIKVENQEM